MAGGASGICLGVALTLLQEHFGLIRLQGDPGTLAIAAYPVHLDPTDILLTLLPITVFGVATALITTSYAKSRTRNRETVVS